MRLTESKLRQIIREELLHEDEAADLAKSLDIMNNLSAGQKVKITWSPGKTTPDKITKATVTHSVSDMKKAGMKTITVGITVKKGGGVIQWHGGKFGLQWSPTMQASMMIVKKLERG